MAPRRIDPAAPCSIVVAACVSGCMLLLGERTEQCRTHAQCQALDPGYVCASDGVCVPLTRDQRALEGFAGSECRSDTECARTKGQAVCRSGACVPLNEPELGCASLGWGTTSPPDGAPILTLGMLVAADEIGGRPRQRLAATVGLAILDFNRARESFQLDGLPALVGVACDESRPESLDYLLDSLRVRVIFGPTDPARLESVLSRTGDRALLIPSFADGPNLQPQGTEPAGSILSCRPNRSGIRAYLLDAIAEAREQIAAVSASSVGSIVPALAVSGDVATVSFASGFDDGQLAAAGVRRTPYLTEPGGRGLVGALASADPAVRLIVAASAEDAWEDNIPAVDGAAFARGGTYPYYLLADKRFAVLQTVLRDQLTAQGFPRQYRRILGLDYARSDQTTMLRSRFENAFVVQTQSATEPGFEYVYDCAYAAVYATVAASLRLQQAATGLVPEGILLGLRALQGGGAQRPVGAFEIPSVLASLESSRGADGTIDLIGASGTLDFQLDTDSPAAVARRYVSVVPPGGELYCIDVERQTFCDTGVVFPPGGGAPNRPIAERCTCLRGAP